ncbi:hypothetical protein [Microbacterium gorillae]|uniref:hypothetical protein n=1 Tax=Microbacterium gorillae TaxID=1231063 RepID=UPI00058F0E6F|nr:hypothetical protein [Microbacterium gorillae]
MRRRVPRIGGRSVHGDRSAAGHGDADGRGDADSRHQHACAGPAHLAAPDPAPTVDTALAYQVIRQVAAQHGVDLSDEQISEAVADGCTQIAEGATVDQLNPFPGEIPDELLGMAQGAVAALCTQ